MPTFTFIATDQDGNQITGARSGISRQEVIARLRSEQLVVTSVREDRPVSTGAEPGKPGFFDTFLHGGVSVVDLMTSTRQLATMLGAGISLTDALHTVAHGLSEGRLRKALLGVRSEVQRGMTFADALRRHPEAFDNLYVSLVHAGEASGSLGESVGRLADYIERKEQFRQKMKSATAYPKFIVFFFVGITALIFFFLIPRFKEVFSDFGTNLPWITTAYIAVSDFLRAYILILLPVLAALYVLYRYFLFTETGSRLFDRLVLKMPYFGPLMLKAAMERLSVTMGTLLGNGIALTDALHIATATLNNSVLEAELRNARAEVMKGRGLAESLARMPSMPRLLARMVHVGEESGTLSDMFEEVSTYFYQEVDRALGRIAAIIEPVLICGMGAIVLTTLLALYMPLFRLSRGGARGG